MADFKHSNRLTGWVVFLIALSLYLFTLEPSVSLWDCGEFIATSYKLEVGHPPGAPFFLLAAKIFSLFAPAKFVPLLVNSFSAVASAFTVLFLFWTITGFAGRLYGRAAHLSKSDILLIEASGVIGALVFAFSDSFWFSAVEGEVYAFSSLFTAIIFWSVLKWEEESGKNRYSGRWLILITYLTGLSVGVHLLNLLTIPAVVLVICFKKYPLSWYGLLLSVVVSLFLLAAIQYLLIPGIVKIAFWSELLFVNGLHLPYGTGVWTYITVAVTILTVLLFVTYQKKKVFLHQVILALTLFILGYSSYALVLIRSGAQPPVNEGDPSNVLNFISYLDREQYGERPLFYGPYYNAPVSGIADGKPVYAKRNNRYEIDFRRPEYQYDPHFYTFFPRMYSHNPDHVKVYQQWTQSAGIPVKIMKDGKVTVMHKPSFGQNLAFFIKYQVGYMYFRYFMWNFSGKQNDYQGNGGILYGNFITGIPFIDNLMLGPQEKLPEYLRNNRGRNTYFLLPLLLGLAGLFYQVRKSKKDFWVIVWLFIMTGLAIVFYLNQTPLQPRERDYAYTGSFYAFSIWIGLGVFPVAGVLKKLLKRNEAFFFVVLGLLALVPLRMVLGNFDDHNRSERYIAHDFAANYLNTCAPNAILFTSGDNDTYPLWYLQEVEGVRTDVRVCNLALLNADWYIRQMKRKSNFSDPLPIRLANARFREGQLEAVYVFNILDEYADLQKAVSFAASDSLKDNLITGDKPVPDFLPSAKLIIPVDTTNLVQSGVPISDDSGNVKSYIPLELQQKYLSKGEFMVLDILANNHWKRPIYYSSPTAPELFGMSDYLQTEGFAYRLVPVETASEEEFDHGRVATKILYDRLMQSFRWGGLEKPGVLIDDFYRRWFREIRLRVNFARLAEALYHEGKRDSARAVIDRCMHLMPVRVVPHDVYSLRLGEACFKIGAFPEGEQVVNEYAEQCFDELKYFDALPLRLKLFVQSERDDDLAVLDKLGQIAQKYGRTELAGRIEYMVSAVK